jgi:predicted AlkP superfamily pyrophosphatase or phosphodiesterase
MQARPKFVAALAVVALLPQALRAEERRVSHVLLISVDGLHQRDLSRFIAGHPGSALAQLSRSGVTYDDAHATTPSDSFPGLLALVTGGTPKSTGV